MTYSLAMFEAYLEENEKRGYKNGFFVGDEMTIADFKAGQIISYLLEAYYRDAHAWMAPCPKLAAWAHMMASKMRW